MKLAPRLPSVCRREERGGGRRDEWKRARAREVERETHIEEIESPTGSVLFLNQE